MRSSTLVFALIVGGVVGCDDDDDHWRRDHGDQSSILFAIHQQTDAATGKTTTTTSYEYLALGGRGWSQVRSQEDGECFFEDMAGRLGRSHVEGGTARFIGPKLPAGGLVLTANQD